MRARLILSSSILLALACKPEASGSAKDQPGTSESPRESVKPAAGETGAAQAKPAQEAEAPAAPEAGEPQPTTKPYQSPKAVLAAAKQSPSFVEQQRCAPAESFPTFTLRPSRWVEFQNDWGTLRVIASCTESNAITYLAAYPNDEPGRRYVVFFGEAGMAVEEQVDGRWDRRCDGRDCDGVEASMTAAWLADYSLAELDDPVFELVEALELPEDYESASNRRGLDPAQVSGFVVFDRDGSLFVAAPDGSTAMPLDVAAPERYRSRSRGNASDKPLVSPDGETLAHLLDGTLCVTALDTRKTRVADKLGAPVLIGSWSPDGKALMVVVGDGPDARAQIVDVAKFSAVALEASGMTWWGRDAGELVALRRGEQGREIVRGTAPKLANPELLAALPDGYRVADVRGEVLALVGDDAVWVVEGPGAKPRKIADTAKVFISSVRLSPSLEHVAFRHQKGPEQHVLAAFALAGASEPIELGFCDQSCAFYWYDASHVVIPGRSTVELAGLDGLRATVAEDVRGIMQRQHR